MTEKRFECKADYDWWYVRDNTGRIKGEYNDWFSTDEVVNLLNSLVDENEQLKQELSTLNSALCEVEEVNKGLSDENEQLKHDYGQLQYEMSQIIEKYNELEKENEIMLGGLTLYQEKSADLELRNIRQAEQLDELSEENEQLKKELYLIDKLIEDLGHEEMKRQYEEIINGDVE